MKRSEDVWLSDGNVIICAAGPSSGSDCDTRVLFKVHRSILSRHSAVLHDMFGLPLTYSAEEAYEGVPLVYMHDDPVDVQNLIHALYNHESFLPPPAGSPSIETIFSVLRISTKYVVTFLRKRAILHLSDFFPLTPNDALKTRRTLAKQRGKTRAHYVDIPDIISRAHESHIPWIIPWATYLYMFEATTANLHHYVRDIEPGDRDLCLVSFAHKCMHLVRLSLYVQDFPHHQCATEYDWNMLRSIFVSGTEVLLECVLHPLYYTDVLWKVIDQTAPNIRKCPGCTEFINGKIEGARTQYWEELPTILGLGTWAALEKMRADELATDNRDEIS
ncbi:hypothetical protein FISHEDRAFT_75541 [Fistulina hepatica ATCC 64428]|uniref:BTB domain-containing protein n=1 Tax=Fistulina hepatica ATCC 64428 TaxID=1128425 RepID=A0A0D7A6T6_9AGAR|nr:hypothetical protein FISHEDRAFT_75541 [Fistulina hepatica ATCC 64428]